MITKGEAEKKPQTAVANKEEADTQRQLALETVRISKSQAIAAFALVEMDKDPELSLLLTTKSVKRDYFAGKDIPLLSESVFRQAAVNSRVGVAFTGHDDAVWDVEIGLS